MCIIAIKPKGAQMFSDRTIKTMFINNPDGAGYMFFDGSRKKVIIKKGFMTCDSLLKSLHSKDFTNTNLVLHFRITTSGNTDALNCHPFPLYSKNVLRCAVDIGMAHNGILRDFEPAKTSPINDTQVFIRDVLNNLKPSFLGDNDKMMLIRKLIKTNKLAFLDNKNHVTMVGGFIHDGDYYYSNKSYEFESLYSTSARMPRGTYVSTYSKAFGGDNKTSAPANSKIANGGYSVDKTKDNKKFSINDHKFWDDDDDDDDKTGIWSYLDNKYKKG